MDFRKITSCIIMNHDFDFGFVFWLRRLNVKCGFFSEHFLFSSVYLFRIDVTILKSTSAHNNNTQTKIEEDYFLSLLYSKSTSISFSTGCIGSACNFHAKRCEWWTLFNHNDNTTKSIVCTTTESVPISNANGPTTVATATVSPASFAKQPTKFTKQWAAHQQPNNAYQTTSYSHSHRSWWVFFCVPFITATNAIL